MKRRGTFQSGPVVVKTVPERSNFSAKWSGRIGTGCAFRARANTLSLIAPLPPPAIAPVASRRIVFKDGIGSSSLFRFRRNAPKPGNQLLYSACESREKEREREAEGKKVDSWPGPTSLSIERNIKVHLAAGVVRKHPRYRSFLRIHD